MNSKSIRVAVLAVLFLATSVLAIAAQDHAMNMKEHQLSKQEVKALIVSAKTPEDHMKLASYFRGEARQQESSAKYHDEMAELYKNNRSAKMDMAKHCKYLAWQTSTRKWPKKCKEISSPANSSFEHGESGRVARSDRPYENPTLPHHYHMNPLS